MLTTETAIKLVSRLEALAEVYEGFFSKDAIRQMTDLVEQAKSEMYAYADKITKLPNLTEHAKELLDFVKNPTGVPTIDRQ